MKLLWFIAVYLLLYSLLNRIFQNNYELQTESINTSSDDCYIMLMLNAFK